MAYTALAIANSFLKLARNESGDREITPMKLQKLVYYAHAWHLYIKDKPLSLDKFYRWRYGPVVPGLYSEFRGYGSGPITSFGTRPTPANGSMTPVVRKDDVETWKLLRKIWEEYGDMDGIDLSALSHNPKGAWAKTAPDALIPDELIKQEIAETQG